MVHDRCSTLLTEFGTALTTILPISFQYCYKYCYSDSWNLWAVMRGGWNIYLEPSPSTTPSHLKYFNYESNCQKHLRVSISSNLPCFIWVKFVLDMIYSFHDTFKMTLIPVHINCLQKMSFFFIAKYINQ
jgi:hypothetical protein